MERGGRGRRTGRWMKEREGDGMQKIRNRNARRKREERTGEENEERWKEVEEEGKQEDGGMKGKQTDPLWFRTAKNHARNNYWAVCSFAPHSPTSS